MACHARASTRAGPAATIVDAVMAVHDGVVECALVPIENSLEGSVERDPRRRSRSDATGRRIIGRSRARDSPVPDRADARSSSGEIDTVVSHPQATRAVRRFIRTRLSAAPGSWPRPRPPRRSASSLSTTVRGRRSGADSRPSATGARCSAPASRTPRATRRGSSGSRGRPTRQPGIPCGESRAARVEDGDRVLGRRFGVSRLARGLPGGVRDAGRQPDAGSSRAPANRASAATCSSPTSRGAPASRVSMRRSPVCWAASRSCACSDPPGAYLSAAAA